MSHSAIIITLSKTLQSSNRAGLGCSVLVYYLSSAMSVLAMFYSITRVIAHGHSKIFLYLLSSSKVLNLSFIVVSPSLAFVGTSTE